MYTQFFFDDARLFERENLKRVYGEPKLLGVLEDEEFKTSWPAVWAIKTPENFVRLLYMAKSIKTQKIYAFTALSKDYVNFEKEELGLDSNLPKGALFELPHGVELTFLLLDTLAEEQEKYKLFYTRFNKQDFNVVGGLKVSSDLIHWQDKDGYENWNNGAEPMVGMVKNVREDGHIITIRPTWGERRIGYKTTKDFKTFSNYSFCMQPDSLDNPLEEIYGLPFEYFKGVYIGFPHVYGDLKSVISAKYASGTIKPQLAYSINGKNWQRSLREPFIKPTRALKKGLGFEPKMVWLNSFIENEKGEIFIYAGVTQNEHGVEWAKPTGKIGVFKLRKDGFIGLKTKGVKTSTLATREFLYNGGEITFNIKGKKATIAVFESKNGDKGVANLLAQNQLIKGFSHKDCISFSGDCTDYSFKFKERDLLELKGKTIVFEIKIRRGEIYSITGDLIPMMNTESERYRQLNLLPAERTF